MRKYLSITVALLILALFVLNFNQIFDYEVSEVFLGDYDKVDEDLDYLEEISEGTQNEVPWADRPSIDTLLVSSGNLENTPIKFDRQETEEVSEEENQKIFFFGRPEEDFEEFDNDDWDFWGENPNLELPDDGRKRPSREEPEPEPLEPVEVTLDEFIGNSQ